MRELARCERKTCREPLTFEGFDGIGRPIFACKPCERNRAGRCRRCHNGRMTPHPRGGFGNGKFCHSCKSQVEAEQRLAQRDAANARSRRWRARNRAYVNQRAREWRRTHRRDALDTLYDSLKGKRRRQDPEKRQHDRERRRENHRRCMRDPKWVENERARNRNRYHAKKQQLRSRQEALAA